MFAFESEAFVDMLQRAAGRHEQVPQPGFVRDRFQILDQRDRLPAVARIDLFFILADSGADVAVEKQAHPVAEERLAFRKVKIHVRAPACKSPADGSKTG